MKKKKVAINIITTHDEPNLLQCLESIRNLDPEIVIGYNGDISKPEYEICKKYATLLDVFKWEDDFASARNRIKNITQSDWIIWLDSDETIDKESIIKINELLDSGPKNLYHNFKLIHGSTTTGQLRMFFNTEKIYFKNKIHERIVPDIYPQNHYDIKITHHIQNTSRSSIRNINILEEELEKDPNNLDLNFFLAIEYHLIGKQMKALLYAEKYLNGYLGNDVNIKKMYIRYLISWIYTYHLGNYQKAMEIMLAQLISNCNIAEFWCLLGDIFVKIGKFKNAKRFYENAFLMGEYKYDNMWLINLEKYNEYPKFMAEQCKLKENVDLQKFNFEINQPIIP